MNSISNLNELNLALKERVSVIKIKRSMLVPNSIILGDGVTLEGLPQENGELPLIMFQDCDGIGLTKNNTIKNVNIQTSLSKKAIFLTNGDGPLGHFDFQNLVLTGQFSFIMRSSSSRAQLKLTNIDIVAADAKKNLEQPQKYGVNVLQGALTIYNFNSSPHSLIEVTTENITIGRKNQPVIGSGIFIAGFGDTGGKVNIYNLHTKSVYSTGNIPFGVSNIITAAIFISTGAHAKSVIHDGEIITYGVNDMVLDTWGIVDYWEARELIASYGPSGVGFVNFGKVIEFVAMGALETYGLGARGYNQYDGSLEKGSFKSINTFGDGSVGIQVSKKVGTITIQDSVTTHGSVGNTLVKGTNIELPAYALSIKDGGIIKKLVIANNITSFGDNVITCIIESGGSMNDISLGGKLEAFGNNSHAFELINGGHAPASFPPNN